MGTVYHIDGKELPIDQNFGLLKQQALEFIQAKSGNQWNNLNPSDPGITILDQICFALTELGYCNDFSIADILTRQDGELILEDQFYLPEQILTTSPVTLTDYRKFLIDGIKSVRNVLFQADPVIPNQYQVYLLVNPVWMLGSNVADETKSDTDLPQTKIQQICEESFYYLNKSRNLGETFAMPQQLEVVQVFLVGEITISQSAKPATLLTIMQESLCDLVFPRVQPTGYYDSASQESAETIFEGPKLSRGWISDDALGNLLSQVSVFDVTNNLSVLAGVEDCSLSGFMINEKTQTSVKAGANQFIYVDIEGSIQSGNLKISQNGLDIPVAILLNPGSENRSSSGNQVIYGEQFAGNVNLPKGKFRDIDTYYSIQNTLPEIFGVGDFSVEGSGNSFEVSRSRQLRGYLTLIDQLIANQFSQLANVPKLFSFRNAMVGDTTGNRRFYAHKTEYEKKHLEYPVPFESFSPTYFYRTLYDVPFIRPLLKDFNSFDFSYEVVSQTSLEMAGWESYKMDPFNAYSRGLMEIIEDVEQNLERRVKILDHLLARHGESPVVLKTIIDGSSYYGNSTQDEVIFKSLFLQNLGLLSYYRQKGYNYLGANELYDFDSAHRVIDDTSFGKLCRNFYSADFEQDFVFSAEFVNRLEKLTEQDFVNFSALELKISLLFGLKPIYRTFLKDSDPGLAESEAAKMKSLARWLIESRRGLILIEPVLIANEIESGSNADELDISDDVILILPDFIPVLKTKKFKDRLKYFLEQELPVNLSYSLYYADVEDLELVSKLYVALYNSMRFRENRRGAQGSESDFVSGFWGKLNQLNKEEID